MAYTYLPSNLPQILREAGLKVVEIDGWQRRGRPSSTGGFAPVGVLCHHTATGPSVSVSAVLNLLVRGRSDLPGPLCHLGLGRDGTVYVIAAGRANHAGQAKASGTVAAGDGNSLYIGIEAFNDGRGEPWPKEQYDAYVTLCAVLSAKVTGNSAQTVRAHKETSVTGKIDPTFAMDPFRERVAARMKAGFGGEIAMMGGATAPKGWALCQGQAVGRTDPVYARLFAIIGTTYGPGDGVNTFNLPDMRGRFPLGGGPGIDGTTRNAGWKGGQMSLTEANLPAHTHTINHDHSNASVAMRAAAGGSTAPVRGNATADGTASVNIPAYSGNSGSTGSGSVFLPPATAINYVIKL